MLEFYPLSPTPSIIEALAAHASHLEVGMPVMGLACRSTWLPEGMLHVLAALALLVNIRHLAAAQESLGKAGLSCNVSNSLLLVASNQLMTDCGYLAWCDPSSSKCQSRGCRKDEYPFGYSVVERSKWPPLCNSSRFCPDEGSFCMDKVALGGACQLNRDDECATSTKHPKVVCLHNTCVAVNATLNSACVHENVVYTTFTPDNSSYGSIVSRDNCGTALYCDSVSSSCLAQKAKGVACSADKECLTDFCQDTAYTPSTPDNNNDSGTCAEQPFFTARQHRVWVYLVVVLVALVPMMLLILTLLKLHQRQGLKRRGRLQAYWDGQRSIQQKVQMFKVDLRSYAASPHASSFNSESKLLRKKGSGYAESREGLLDSPTPISPQTPSVSTDAQMMASSSKLRRSVTYGDSINSSPGLQDRYRSDSNAADGDSDGFNTPTRPLSMQADSHWRKSHSDSTQDLAGMYDATLNNSDPHSHQADVARGSYTEYVDAFHTPSASQQDLLDEAAEHLAESFGASQTSLVPSNYESTHSLSVQGHGSPQHQQHVRTLMPSSSARNLASGLRNREGTAQARRTGEGPSSPEARRESLVGDWSFFASEGHGHAR